MQSLTGILKPTKLLVVLSAVAVVPLHAQTIQCTVQGINPYLSVSGSFDGGSSFGDEWAGRISFDKFDSFCGEPLQGVYLNEVVTYDILDPGAVPNYHTLSCIVGEYLASPQDNLNAAAAQWAVWKVVVDGTGSFSFSSGQIQIAATETTVSALATDYLNHAGSYTPAPITVLSNPTRQDMVAITPIPEPGSLLLVGIGALGLLRRRRPV